jgi:hypothetical protein
MGAPFEADKDEMQTAALMVTVRNERGRAMLDEAVRRGRVEVLLDGGRGGAALPSTGDRSKLAFATFERDSIVKSLTDASFVAADAGAPSWVGDILAKFIAKTLPTGLEFARYSIDYHFLRNQLFCEERMGKARADRHVPRFASAVQAPYAEQSRRPRSCARISPCVTAFQKAGICTRCRETPSWRASTTSTNSWTRPSSSSISLCSRRPTAMVKTKAICGKSSSGARVATTWWPGRTRRR